MRLCWSQQMLRFNDEDNYAQLWGDCWEKNRRSGKVNFEILIFRSWYGSLAGSKVVVHQKPVYNMMRARNTVSRISTLLFVPSCNKLNNQCHFLSILKSIVLTWGHTHLNCALWLHHFDFSPYHSSILTNCWPWILMRGFLSHHKYPSKSPYSISPDISLSSNFKLWVC